MEEVIAGLYASPPETLPFAPLLEIRASLLQRDPGNLLIYGAGTFAADAHEVEGMGGVWRHYLNHRHEAAFVGDKHARTPGAPLFCHENERRSVSERLEVSGTFSGRHVVGDDFEVIPIPGHTRGATAYLWDTGSTAASSPAIRSISAGASGWPRCCRRATAKPTSRAWSSSAGWTSMCLSPGRRRRVNPTTTSPTKPTPDGASTRYWSGCVAGEMHRWEACRGQKTKEDRWVTR